MTAVVCPFEAAQVSVRFKERSKDFMQISLLSTQRFSLEEVGFRAISAGTQLFGTWRIVRFAKRPKKLNQKVSKCLELDSICIQP